MNINFQFFVKTLTTVLGVIFFAACTSLSARAPANADAAVDHFRNPALAIEVRVQNLISLLSWDEKIAQMNSSQPAIKRLGIPAYNWQTEGLHGAASYDYETTVYPQVIGLAASWDTQLLHEVSTATSDEIRAIYFRGLQKYHASTENNGLTVWAPNINIFRDPRWGRGQETYGEDPFLTSRLSLEYIQGLQGIDPNHWKLVATPKHFAVYSGPEKKLFHTNLAPTEKDLRETYLPAFEAAIREGHAHSLMCAYGSVDGQPSCANSKLMNQILRAEWGFQGTVVSDCGAVRYIWDGHHIEEGGNDGHAYASGPIDAAIDALHAGTDLACPGITGSLDYSFLKSALEDPKISKDQRKALEAAIDQAVTRIFSARFHLGMFDPPRVNSYSKLEHQKLAIKAARESIVLLKNENRFLPLQAQVYHQISVIGPNADNPHFTNPPNHALPNALLGTYHGDPTHWVTPFAGIRSKLKKLSPTTRISFSDGKKNLTKKIYGSDLVILVLGLQPVDDAVEKGMVVPNLQNGEGEGTDRTQIELPVDQEAMIQTVKSAGIPMVVVLMNGSAVSSVSAEKNANAILETWYPGEEGGTAIADVLFGDYNPAGRLPVTFYRSTQDLPDFSDYHMNGRTYRYFQGKPLYPFGFGLSFTRFHYSSLEMDAKKITLGNPLHFQVTVQNEEGAESAAGDEVVEVYLSGPENLKNQPLRSLKAFQRVHFEKGEKKNISFTFTRPQLEIFLEDGAQKEVPGHYTLSVGSHQPDRSSSSTDQVVTRHFEITP